MLTDTFCADFSAALEASKKLPPKEGFDSCVNVIKKHNLCYDFDGPCDQFLVHEENRSRLMLTAGKCHENEDKIHFAGADLTELNAAFAFELSKLKARRAMQVNKNKKLIKRAGGLLAEVTGLERFCTVGCSHISQFCKLAMQGGKTSRPKLRDPDTNQLDVGRLKRNANYKTMIEKGWRWCIFPSEIDEQFPQFAKLAQRALNSSNNCRQTTSEIELACQMVEFHDAAEDEGNDDPKQAAVDAVQENVSSCHGYAKVLLDYATDYGGGKELPWLRLVDDLQKHHDASKVLGGAFWNSIYSLRFWSDSKVDKSLQASRPLMRLCILCLQSCMHDHRDGIASFVTDTDL